MSSERAPPKKRRRIVISCTECHRRKQKCDRELPCSNCKSRNKEDRCEYDTSAPTAKGQRAKEQSPQAQQDVAPGLVDAGFASQAADWGYSQTGPSTMGLLRKIESADSSATPTQDQSGGDSRLDNGAIADKYKSLIRQLPSRQHIQTLAKIYFRHLNWHYAFLEEVIFYEQLDEWNSLPFSALSTPLKLDDEIRVFPALLFQVLAMALLVLPDVDDVDEKEFETLKYAAGMSWEDLAIEVSESGNEVLRLFGKRHIALATVQAQFLRASFSKYTAKVAESWHVLASAIRDAQELGMHRDSLDPKPKDQSIESVLENQWLIQVRRKMYMILAVWDMSCAMILGRPSLMSWGPGLPTRAIDAIVPPNRRSVPLIARDAEKEPPTPVTRALWLTNMTPVMREIQLLQDEGPFPKDFSRVDQIHARIMGLEDAEPAFLRIENPNTQWDDDPDRKVWIQDARVYFNQFHNFCMLALHRPYMFHRRKSRDMALRACMSTLECHQSIFKDLPTMSWRNYLLFFGSFDAIVVVSSIFIMYPHEQVELRESALQHFRWTIMRFETMQSRNGLAKSALGVLKAVLSKFVNVIDGVRGTAVPKGPSSTSTVGGASSVTPGSSHETAMTTPSSVGDKALMDMIEGPSLRDSANAIAATSDVAPSYPPPPPAEATTAAAPTAREDFDFPSFLDNNSQAAMSLFPTSDLVWSDLNVLDGQGAIPASFGDGMTLDPMMMDWKFGGGIGDDTVWGFLNQYQPGQA